MIYGAGDAARCPCSSTASKVGGALTKTDHSFVHYRAVGRAGSRRHSCSRSRASSPHLKSAGGSGVPSCARYSRGQQAQARDQRVHRRIRPHLGRIEDYPPRPTQPGYIARVIRRRSWRMAGGQARIAGGSYSKRGDRAALGQVIAHTSASPGAPACSLQQFALGDALENMISWRREIDPSGSMGASTRGVTVGVPRAKEDRGQPAGGAGRSDPAAPTTRGK